MHSWDRQLRSALGEFDLGGLEPLAANEARLTLRAKNSGETYTIDYWIEPSPPHRLASMMWEKRAAETPLTFNSTEELDRALANGSYSTSGTRASSSIASPGRRTGRAAA